MMKSMLVSAAVGVALALGIAGQPAFAANECSDCTAPAAATPSSRDQIRAARSSDAKRIADEPATRPWDGMKLTAPPPNPRIAK